MTQVSQPDIMHSRHLPPPRLTVRIADATKMLGIGRSKLYELIGAGEVETIKLGAATLIIVDSIQALIERARSRKRCSNLQDRDG